MSNVFTLIVAVFCFVVGIGVNLEDINNRCYQQAIEHHAAEYNATTGEFEWLK